MMQIISFRNTALFKSGIWLSGAALIACVTAPFMLDGSLWRNPLPNMFGVAALCLILGYLLWKAQIHRLADEVIDCGDSLKVRRGGLEATIPFSNIATADVSTSSGIHRITVRLRDPTKLGNRIEFLPQASLWSNLGGVQRVAAGLAERGNQAKGTLTGARTGTGG
jgi:hypothetical protein